jgi:hypothetical protein
MLLTVPIEDISRRGHIDLVKSLLNDKKLKWDVALKGAYEGNHIDIINLIIDKYRHIDRYEAFIGACYNSNKEIIESMIKNGYHKIEGIYDPCWEICMYNACRGNNKEIIDLILGGNNREYTIRFGFEGACYGGHKELVEFFMNKYSKLSLYVGFDGACCGNHIDIINLIIKKNNDENNENFYWEYGIFGACYGGHKELIELIVEKRRSFVNFNWGLCGACRGNQYEIAELMVSYGAKDLYCGLEETYSYKIINSFLKKGIRPRNLNFVYEEYLCDEVLPEKEKDIRKKKHQLLDRFFIEAIQKDILEFFHY